MTAQARSPLMSSLKPVVEYMQMPENGLIPDGLERHFRSTYWGFRVIFPPLVGVLTPLSVLGLNGCGGTLLHNLTIHTASLTSVRYLSLV